MFSKALVGSVLWITVSALPAQFLVGIGSESRRMTRVTWRGLSGEQTVALEYGQPKWRTDYERIMQEQPAGPVLLGKGALTTLRTDVELAFGTQKLARGRWYVGARLGERQQWSLALFAADRVDASGRGASFLLANEPDVRVPVLLTHVAESVELLEGTLTLAKGTPHKLALTLAWGPYRLGVEFAAAFDDRNPDGAPEFALPAPGKGTRTASGLIYETLRAGAGKPPGHTDRVRVHYSAWLSDGTMFDSSYLRREPETLKAEWVIKGFAEGLQLMQPGATFRLVIPPELGYGASGAGEQVPPNATLVFTVTLVSVDGR
ncbi:MAG TPA: FKBP-type peptidyl-prolyl cis-trans isomerase [Planctomycetota bacterium]|nr:FKBP-type peptidyl-prolyl cis-trans isomerase [Planctomycetota bacterium]